MISDGGLYFCGIGGDIPLSLFIASIRLLSLSLFLSVWLVVYFVDLFKKPALGFIDFFEGFFVSLSPSVLL